MEMEFLFRSERSLGASIVRSAHTAAVGGTTIIELICSRLYGMSRPKFLFIEVKYDMA